MKSLSFGLSSIAIAAGFALASVPSSAVERDQFFWLSQMNKASVLINTQEGLLSEDMGRRIAKGLQNVIDNGSKPGAKRPGRVIKYEPFLIKEAGIDATMLHVGRSSQDMHATYNVAVLRDYVLEISLALSKTMDLMHKIAEDNVNTIVPNYTNGVAAQPNSYAHYLYGFLASFERDQQKLSQFYDRLNTSPMGTTVLNGTSWPLNRDRMASYLGFRCPTLNAYDAAQTKPIDELIEMSGILSGIALHVCTYIQDVMTQYAQPRPWILLVEGGNNTYVSSAMPQKRNPGLLINTRRAASTLLGDAHTMLIRDHNLAPGFIDPKSNVSWGTYKNTVKLLNQFNRCLSNLVINPERALEELNLDWTASQEVADVLMRKYRLPFRVGHHFASQMVGYARAHGIKPLDFPYKEAQRIYAEEITKEYPSASKVLPMSESELKATLNPVEIIRNRKTAGGPQPQEMARQLKIMKDQIGEHRAWAMANQKKITEALSRLDADFSKYLPVKPAAKM